MLPQDTLQVVTDSLPIINAVGDTVNTVLQRRAILEDLSDGIDWFFFFYAFVGSLIHLMLKLIYSMNKSVAAKTPFFFINWCKENGVYFVVSILCGMLSVFFIDSFWEPVSIPKSIIGGTLAGVAAFYIYPVVTNPDVWTGIGTWIVNKFRPK